MKTIRTILLVLCLLSLTVSLAGAQEEVTISMTDLGTLGGDVSQANGINDLGQVVGSSFYSPFSGLYHAFLWSADTGMIDLGTLDGGPESIALDINNLGQVVGYSFIPSDTYHAFLWTVESGMTDLGTLGGFSSEAHGINNLGQVVGYSWTATEVRRAFLWTEDAGMTDLGTLGGDESWAYDINDLGQVVGYSSTSTGVRRAFLWTEDAGMTDLGTLGGDESWAAAINNPGQVVGWSTTALGDTHAFLWTAEAGMTDMGDIHANGINDLGQVVGLSFLWTAESGMIDLGTQEGDSGVAYDINNFGQIVGYSNVANGYPHATLWTITSTSPEDQAQALVDQVNNYVAAGKLNDGQGNALTTKINNVLTQLAKNKPRVACNSLNAFTNQVQSFIDEGVLSASDGQMLIQAADAIKGEVCP